jgi:predicted lipid-binding transport protein (Tim44 family)
MNETTMNETTEWEVVDAPAPDARQTMRQLMKTLLGPWWKWKIAGVATIAGLALVFFAALTGVLMLVILIGAITSVGIGKFRQWRRRDRRAVSL